MFNTLFRKKAKLFLKDSEHDESQNSFERTNNVRTANFHAELEITKETNVVGCRLCSGGDIGPF